MNVAPVWTEPLPLPWLQVGALGLAWAWDRLFGEPPNALHPVAWLGHLLGPLGGRLKRLPPRPAFIGGAPGRANAHTPCAAKSNPANTSFGVSSRISASTATVSSM